MAEQEHLDRVAELMARRNGQTSLLGVRAARRTRVVLSMSSVVGVAAIVALLGRTATGAVDRPAPVPATPRPDTGLPVDRNRSLPDDESAMSTAVLRDDIDDSAPDTSLPTASVEPTATVAASNTSWPPADSAVPPDATTGGS